MGWHDTNRHDEIHDVVVIGARCAGAATAMLLAGQGLDVLLVDRAHFPSDTLSTHALSRGGIVQLDRWGLLDEVVDSGAPLIRNVSFPSPYGIIEKPIKPGPAGDFLMAPRRHILDTILVNA